MSVKWYIYDACGNRTCSSLSEGGAAEEYANSFEAGDRLAGWSRADYSIGPDSVTNTVYLYAASGCTTGVVSHVADGTVRRVEYTWTDDYRLAGVSVEGAMVAEYKYDVFGNLVGVATTDESYTEGSDPFGQILLCVCLCQQPNVAISAG